MSPSLSAAGVRVPCSTSNLGAGFDCIGLALDRYLEADFAPTSSGGLQVDHGGTLSGLSSDPADDALAVAFRSALEARGVHDVHGRLATTSQIPLARGLGSSAAATVAGLLLACSAAGDEPDRRVLLGEATRIEGHPDNAAPALYGGLVGVVTDADGATLAFRLPLSERIAFAFAAPSIAVSTPHARNVLPHSVAHGTAVRSLSRLAALVHGLATGDPLLLRTGFEDELHVPHRMPLIPNAGGAIAAGRAAGAWAVTISGSGSGLIAVCPPARQESVAAAMADAFASAGDAAAVAFSVRPDTSGARILTDSST